MKNLLHKRDKISHNSTLTINHSFHFLDWQIGPYLTSHASGQFVEKPLNVTDLSFFQRTTLYNQMKNLQLRR